MLNTFPPKECPHLWGELKCPFPIIAGYFVCKLMRKMRVMKGFPGGRPCLLEREAVLTSSIRDFHTRKCGITSRIVHCTKNLCLRIHPSRGERVAQVQNLKRPRRGGTLARISGVRFSARQCIQPHCTRSAATCLGIFEVYTMYYN